MAVEHISDADLARDVRGVLEKVQNGIEVVVEQDNKPVAVITTPPELRRTISDSIAIAKRREQERGYAVTLDPDFAADVEKIVRNREPWDPPSWD